PEQAKDYSFVTDDLLAHTAERFRGELDQYPPVYSAIKKEGVALYELARRGKEVELEARRIHIKEFEITQVNLPLVHFRVVCSTGTYIRSLAHDFGAALGCGAYLSGLCRTRIGEFGLKDALTMEEFEKTLLVTGS
ncbi:MAG TPA: tRNA pseudouridine(55) synthase, partial [Ferruginibacter sp.]|nr:tRNA pseudouridine(55) synthase [Ferruginibacter sp.]